jgi:hypothetical protein
VEIGREIRRHAAEERQRPLEGGTVERSRPSRERNEVAQLSQQLSTGAGQVKTDAADISGVQGALTAISSASTTLSSMATDASNTITQLKSVDAKGSWKTAFSQASSCQTLSGSGS